MIQTADGGYATRPSTDFKCIPDPMASIIKTDGNGDMLGLTFMRYNGKNLNPFVNCQMVLYD